MKVRAALAVFAFAGARSAHAQETLIQHLGLDKLQIVSLGGSVGRILPSQVEPTMVYGISADYGEILPSWRVNFSASYWSSRYRDVVVNAFLDTLSKSVSDPNGGAQIVPSRISLYDVTIGADLRFVPNYSGELKPFFGVGLAAHVINAEGKLIQGTFVERSLDDIAGGMYVVTGVSFRLIRHLGLEGNVRGDLLSGFRSTQARVGGTYYFGRIRGTKPSPPGPP